MYYIVKQFEVSVAHRLHLNYESPCTRLHGHNLSITVYCKARELDENGMVIDFQAVKRRIHDCFDHQNLNDLLPFNPTAENIARWITEQIPQCYRTEVRESEKNLAVYEEDAED